MKKDAHDIIRRPIITEKATDAKELHNKITFAVDSRAGKRQVKEAVEEVFKVSVEDVHIINVKRKKKRLGYRSQGYRPGWKKAVVTLKKGSTIDVFDQV